MAIYVYNTKQQSLNAEKLAGLLSFISNDFCGLISSAEEPIIFDDHQWYWNQSLRPIAKLMGGGINIEYEVPTSPTASGSIDPYPKSFGASSTYPCAVWVFDITVPDPDGNIESNNYNTAKISKILCRDISVEPLYAPVDSPSGDPQDKGYYEYDDSNDTYSITSDTSVDENKIYYYPIKNGLIKLNGIDGLYFNKIGELSLEYYGNTLWVDDNRFIIPICGCDTRIINEEVEDDGSCISMIFNRSQSGYESFLSARTYYSLLQACRGLFVHRSGGTTNHPEYGDVGNLNITGSAIKYKNNDINGVAINQPKFKGHSGDPHLDVSTQEALNSGTHELVVINPNNDDRVYRSGSQYTISINHGGTDANEKDIARNNLGFYYGTGEPSPSIPRRLNGTPDEGAVYFQIL